MKMKYFNGSEIYIRIFSMWAWYWQGSRSSGRKGTAARDDDGHDDVAAVISSRSVTRAQAEATGGQRSANLNKSR